MDFERIYKEGDYFKNNPDWSVEDSHWKAVMIAELLKKNEISFNELVEAGCGAGHILTNLQTIFPGKEYIGYDISPQAISLAKPLENKQLRFEAADFAVAHHSQTDVLLIIDVVEHVADYYGFLNGIRDKSRQFVFHIPLDMSCRTIFKPHVNLQQRESVGHIHYFTKEQVWWMLKDCGYEIIDWHYTKPRIDIDKVTGWKANVKKLLRNASYRLARGWSVKMWGGYSVMVLVK